MADGQAHHLQPPPPRGGGLGGGCPPQQGQAFHEYDPRRLYPFGLSPIPELPSGLASEVSSVYSYSPTHSEDSETDDENNRSIMYSGSCSSIKSVGKKTLTVRLPVSNQNGHQTEAEYSDTDESSTEHDSSTDDSDEDDTDIESEDSFPSTSEDEVSI